MTGFRLTPDAKSDLVRIRHYTIRQWGDRQAKNYLSGLRKTIRILAGSPLLGQSRPDVGVDVLSFPHASHVIYYIVHKQQLVVFAILHKRIVPLNHLSERKII